MDTFIEAPNHAWAERMARQRGILIDSIDPAPLSSSPSPAPKPHLPVAKPAIPAKPQATPPAAQEEQPVEVTDDLAPLEEIPLEEVPLEPAPIPAPAPSPSPRAMASPPPARPRPQSESVNFAKPLILGVVLLSLAGIGWAIWSFGFSGGFNGMDSCAKYIPADAEFVAYIDVPKFRKSELYPDISYQLKKSMEQAGSTMSPQDIEMIMVAGRLGQPQIIIMKMDHDYPLRQMGSPGATSAKLEGTEIYKESSGMCYARIASRTYLMGFSEELLANALKQGKGRAISMSAELQKAISAAKGEDHLAAIVINNPGSNTPSCVGIGASISSTVDVKVTACFKTAESAEAWMKTADQMKLDAAKQFAGNSLANADARQIINGITFSRSGDSVTIRGSALYSRLKPIIGGFGAFPMPLPTGPGRSPGMAPPGMPPRGPVSPLRKPPRRP